MSKRVDLPEYKEALKDTENYLSSEEPAQGFTTYSGKVPSDKIYPILFNFQTSLILQLIEKVNSLEKIIVGTKNERKEDLDILSKAFDKLKISPESSRIEIKKSIEPWKYWMPKKQDE